MAVVLRKLYENYIYYIINAKDKRLEGYLFSEPWGITAIVAFYIYFVTTLGPRIMENRKPFVLNTSMKIYNTAQIIANGALFYCGVRHMIENKFSLACQPVNYTWTPEGLRELNLTYCYFLLKISDITDTIFFVLRKKQNQVTFLHIYHHAVMILGGYISSNYVPGGQGYLMGISNCLVHVFMYFYYLVASLNPNSSALIWWKKHITHIQLIQFAYNIVHFTVPLLLRGCEYPKFWSFVTVVQNVYMFVLFSDFYYNAYLRKKIK